MKTIAIPALATVFLLGVGCSGSTGSQGPAGPQGDPGPGAAGAVLAWSAPANVSDRVVSEGVDSTDPVGVFTSDGRLHVVFFSYDDAVTGRDQLYYTTAVAPYSSWLPAVRITSSATDSPAEFDVAPAADGSVHVVFTRDNGTDNTVFHTANTAAALGTFDEDTVYAETQGDSFLFTPRILMRATTAHVVWVNHYDMSSTNRTYYQYSENGGGGFAAPTTFGDSDDFGAYDQFVFASDAAGNFHLAYFLDDGSSEYYMYYQQLPAASSTWSAVSQASADDAYEDLLPSDEPPFFRFDGSNNVYLFWEQYDDDSNPSIYFNIKAAATADFDEADAADVTWEIGGDGWLDMPWSLIGDVQVDSSGNVYAVWKGASSYGGNNSLYPIFCVKKAFDLDPNAGWEDAEVAGRHVGESGDGGSDRTCRLGIAPDGTIHVFWTDYPNYMVEVWHAYKAAGTTFWANGGIVSSPTYSYYYGIGNWEDGATYMIDVGFESDGTPYALLALNPNYLDGDVGYTCWQNGTWLVGRIIDSNNHTDTWGDFWAGTDPSGGLHALWQEEVDPFDNDGTYDLVHSYR